jgi:hypothetical protein
MTSNTNFMKRVRVARNTNPASQLSGIRSLPEAPLIWNALRKAICSKRFKILFEIGKKLTQELKGNFIENKEQEVSRVFLSPVELHLGHRADDMAACHQAVAGRHK